MQSSIFCMLCTVHAVHEYILVSFIILATWSKLWADEILTCLAICLSLRIQNDHVIFGQNIQKLRENFKYADNTCKLTLNALYRTSTFAFEMFAFALDWRVQVLFMKWLSEVQTAQNYGSICRVKCARLC